MKDCNEQNIKEVLEGYKVLVELTKKICKHVIELEIVHERYGDCTYITNIDENIYIVMEDLFCNDYITFTIPTSCIENDTWKEYLDENKDELKLKYGTWDEVE